MHTAALYLEEAGGAQGVQSIHGVQVEGRHILGQGAAICPGSIIGIRLVHDVYNQPVLHHTSLLYCKLLFLLYRIQPLLHHTSLFSCKFLFLLYKSGGSAPHITLFLQVSVPAVQKQAVLHHCITIFLQVCLPAVQVQECTTPHDFGTTARQLKGKAA